MKIRFYKLKIPSFGLLCYYSSSFMLHNYQCTINVQAVAYEKHYKVCKHIYIEKLKFCKKSHNISHITLYVLQFVIESYQLLFFREQVSTTVFQIFRNSNRSCIFQPLCLILENLYYALSTDVSIILLLN